jgi:radical SAM protein with 4Fe4S-binding SPASM domain
LVGDPAGGAELCVDADGTVYPSVLLSGVAEAVCGNLREEPLAQIWRTSPILAQMRGACVADLAEGCRSCPARTLCGGGSRARAVELTGDLRGADRACPMLPPAGRQVSSAAPPSPDRPSLT